MDPDLHVWVTGSFCDMSVRSLLTHLIAMISDHSVRPLLMRCGRSKDILIVYSYLSVLPATVGLLDNPLKTLNHELCQRMR